MEGQWVFGGICHETRDTFLVALSKNWRNQAHTNNIENLWWKVKRQPAETHTRQQDWDRSGHLCEYMYRHFHRDSDIFNRIQNSLLDQHMTRALYISTETKHMSYVLLHYCNTKIGQ